MNKVSCFLTWPKRRWRTLGFGVHSPFAFKFLTTVVRQQDSYYNYTLLRELNRPMPFKYLALIFRCICHFKPGSVGIIGRSDELAQVVRAADSRCTISGIPRPDTAFFIINDPTSDISGIIRPESVVIVTNLQRKQAALFWKRTNMAMKNGMSFDDGKIGIACMFSHLPRQTFKIAFR